MKRSNRDRLERLEKAAGVGDDVIDWTEDQAIRLVRKWLGGSRPASRWAVEVTFSGLGAVLDGLHALADDGKGVPDPDAVTDEQLRLAYRAGGACEPGFLNPTPEEIEAERQREAFEVPAVWNALRDALEEEVRGARRRPRDDGDEVNAAFL